MASLGVNRDQLHKYDCEKMMLEPAFRRWLFTVLQIAGIWEGHFHSEVAILAFGEGRRGLGLDILTALADATGVSKEEVLNSILAEEIKTQKEVTNDRRNRSNRSDRSDDLDNDG